MKTITIRLGDKEYQHLKDFCAFKERNQNDVVRELIRKLSISGVLNPID